MKSGGKDETRGSRVAEFYEGDYVLILSLKLPRIYIEPLEDGRLHD